jgi:GPI ethanolamine phosphate transferase 3 subunit O
MSCRRILRHVLTLLGLYVFSCSFFLAKKTISSTSTCHDAKSLLRETLEMEYHPALTQEDLQKVCWMNRYVDKLVILVVDALRFDFAEHNLPQSFGRRLRQTTMNGRSQLLKFVADPPTVTMQRLKGLTTGSLPTFAEISGNLGGAYIEEDSWINLMANRGFQLGFVGDDTWIDLYPSPWKEAHPFPSFNTRDLDTVDNGCLEYLPALLDDLEKGQLDVVIAHFLGVDHVGHTYGPHTEFMSKKLHQMDEILDTTLIQLESSPSCILTLVFGDHGMTEGGNHGGGTEDEINAALFVHASQACSSSHESYVEKIKDLSQIDIVPTIALAMGIPIPFSNLGGLVPSLIPGLSTQNATLALALNAGQVWRYLSKYSANANRLPLHDVEITLKDAVQTYKEALESDNNLVLYSLASSKFKAFLNEATELGKRVWTRFNVVGMIIGSILIFVVIFICVMEWTKMICIFRISGIKLEEVLTILFIFFSCGLLSFSNSYIENEQHITAFALSVICISISARLFTICQTKLWISSLPLLLAGTARIHEISISGHGIDPSIPMHLAHNPFIFVTSIAVLSYLRLYSVQAKGVLQTATDLLTMAFLLHSWLEKRNSDTQRNGFLSCRIALLLWIFGALTACQSSAKYSRKSNLAIKFALGIMMVTGPSAATTMVLFFFQAWTLHQLYSLKVRSNLASSIHMLLSFVFLSRLS